MDALDGFRHQKDQAFRLDPGSPLDAEQKRTSTGVRYFPPNPALDLVLEVEDLEPKTAIELQTTTGDVRQYERFGHIALEVEGRPVRLTVFCMGDGFFLPFADALVGRETYGAGRCVEPEPMPDGRLYVDFNLAYNPYYAYNARWSCPITPAENRIKVPIRAGEMIVEHT